MLPLISRTGLGLAVLLSASVLLADDHPTPITPAVPVPSADAPLPVPSADAPAPLPIPSLDSTAPTISPAVPAVGPNGWAPGGDAVSGMRVGKPYYWTAPGAAAAGPIDAGYGYGPAPVTGGPSCGCQGGGNAGYGYAAGGVGYNTYGAGYTGTSFYGNYGTMDPYTEHFGPGYYRGANAGHNRFPWYSYRRPWYYTGQPSWNRDTNLPW